MSRFSKLFVCSSFAILASSYVVNLNTKKSLTQFMSMNLNEMEPTTSGNFLKSNYLNKLSIVGKAVSAALLFDLSKSIAVAENEPSSESPVGSLVTSSTGLKYIDTKIGEGASPLPGDTVSYNYMRNKPIYSYFFAEVNISFYAHI